MIKLPPGFNASALVADLVALSLPIVECAVVLAVFVVITKTLRKL